MTAPRLEVINDSGKANHQVFDSVKQYALERLNELIRVLMDNIDDTLFELSDKVGNDEQRNLYFEAMREIRLKREGIKQNFDFELHELFDEFINGKAARASDDDEEELTLVELDDLEDNIAVDNMVSKARPRFEDDLFALIERLKLILKREEIGPNENPFDPKAICNSFHKASDLLETDIQVKLILYKNFEKYVINNLGDFYHEINCHFIQNDVLPEFRPDKERMKQTSKFMARRRNDAQVTKSESVEAEAGQSAADTTEEPAEIDLLDTLQRALPRKRQASASGNKSDQAKNTRSSKTGETGATSEDFLSTLNRIQAESLPRAPLSQIDAEAQLSETHRQLEAVREANQAQANGADSDVIEVVSMLFDYIFFDEALPAPVKILIGRLQVPIIKVAILDKEFFNHKSHPARQLLDSISRASLGWSDNPNDQKTLIDKIEVTIERLVAEFDNDIRAFVRALADFEQFLLKEEQKNRRANAALVRREQRKERRNQAARQAVVGLMGKIVKGRELNDEVLRFLETTWSKVLFKAYLSLGGSSDHWKYLQRISATLVWTLVPKKTEAERTKIVQTIPALLRALSKSMDLIKIDNQTQNRIFRMLAKEHARIIKQSSKNVVTRKDDRTVWPDEGPAAALANAAEKIAAERAKASDNVELFADDSVTVISAAPTDNVIDDLNYFTAGVKAGKIRIKDEIVLDSGGDQLPEEPANPINDTAQRWAQDLEIGSWVEFKEAKSKSQVARLSWRSKVSGNLVFVNRQGQKVKNLTVHSLASEMRADRVSEIKSSSAFDRAINTIMGKSKK